MINGKKILAIIPARAGSKRLPDKNVLPLDGKPLLAWSIDAARQSCYVDDVVVSTDCDTLMKIAAQYGAEVPFRRPDELASDTASSNAVILHCLEFLRNDGRHYDLVILLQPTSPLRTTADIDSSLELFEKKNARGVISVCECEHSPLWSNILPEDASLADFIRPEVSNLRSQDLPGYYRFNGAIYIFNIQHLIENKGIFYHPDVYAYVMDTRSSVDIDNKLDFSFAEFLLAQNKSSTNNCPGTGHD